MLTREGISYCKVSGTFFSGGKEVGYKVGKGGGRFYFYVNFKGKNVLAHRLAWFIVTGSFPDHDIDHKDMNPLNNKWNNLRPATMQENLRQRRPWSKTGYKGVYHHNGRFKAQIRINKVAHYLGLFDTPEEAARAYDKRAKSEYGDFKKLNFEE